jgi:hypothetical protein
MDVLIEQIEKSLIEVTCLLTRHGGPHFLSRGRISGSARFSATGTVEFYPSRKVVGEAERSYTKLP